MSRLISFILIIAFTSLLFAPVRERVRPHIQPLLDPIYEWSARNRVSTLLKYVQEEESIGRSIPTPHEFPDFVERRDVQANASMDPWGNPYYLHVMRRGYYVGSAGRDQVQGNADDVVSSTAAIQNERRR